jgi:hypothetical protein
MLSTTNSQCWPGSSYISLILPEKQLHKQQTNPLGLSGSRHSDYARGCEISRPGMLQYLIPPDHPLDAPLRFLAQPHTPSVPTQSRHRAALDRRCQLHRRYAQKAAGYLSLLLCDVAAVLFVAFTCCVPVFRVGAFDIRLFSCLLVPPPPSPVLSSLLSSHSPLPRALIALPTLPTPGYTSPSLLCQSLPYSLPHAQLATCCHNLATLCHRWLRSGRN